MRYGGSESCATLSSFADTVGTMGGMASGAAGIIQTHYGWGGVFQLLFFSRFPFFFVLLEFPP